MAGSVNIKLEDGAGFCRIDGSPFQKGSLKAKFEGDFLTISEIHERNVIIEKKHFSNFTNGGGAIYASIAALQTAVESYFFQV